jgi:hypothetical protein
MSLRTLSQVVAEELDHGPTVQELLTCLAMLSL